MKSTLLKKGQVMIQLFFILFMFLRSYGMSEPLNPETPLFDNQDMSVDIKTPSYEFAFIKMLLALIAILGFAALAFYLFRKLSHTQLQQGNQAKNIKILEKRAISTKSVLYLIEVGGKKMLVGESQFELRQISPLEWIESEKKGV